MSISEIGQLVALLWSVITTVFAVILYFKKRKTGQTKEETENTLSIIQGLYNISQNIPKYISDAEAIFKGDKLGVARLSYVLQQIKVDCMEHGVTYDEDNYKQQIENIMSTPQKKDNKTEV